MVVVLRRPERVACTECGASYPAFFKGQQCLICDSAIDVADRQRKGAAAMTSKKQRKRKAKDQYEVQIAALQAERDELRVDWRDVEIPFHAARVHSGCLMTSGHVGPGRAIHNAI